MTTPLLPPKRRRARPYKLGVLEIKALVRHRDGYRCRMCGVTSRQHHRRYGRALEVHRLQPGTPYSLEGCVTLCNKCHGPQPRSPRGRQPSGYLCCTLSPELYDALKAYIAAARPRPSVSAVVEAAIEDYLISLGLWPRQPPPPAGQEVDPPCPRP